MIDVCITIVVGLILLLLGMSYVCSDCLDHYDAAQDNKLKKWRSENEGAD